VEALAAAFRSGKRHVADGARDAAVAILEGMDGDEPQMRDRCPQDGIERVRAVEPVEEGGHLAVDAGRGGSLEVDPFAAEWARDDLHGSGLLAAPAADSDAQHAAAPRREQRRMPGE